MFNTYILVLHFLTTPKLKIYAHFIDFQLLSPVIDLVAPRCYCFVFEPISGISLYYQTYV